MTNQNTRRGNTQNVENKNCHSKLDLESHRLLLSKVRSRIKYGMTALFNVPLTCPAGILSLQGEGHNTCGLPFPMRGKVAESRMRGNRGFILRPSSSRSVGVRDIGAAPHGFTARSVTPQCRYAGYSGRIGFTLIELLVVVLIIGILSAVALPQYQMAVEKSRAMQGITVARALHDAPEAYYLEHGRYATSQQTLDVNITCPPDYTCSVNTQKILVRYKNYPWEILYSHNYRNDDAYSKGKLYCWESYSTTPYGKSVCDRLGKMWHRVDSNKRLLN